jgi:outer membrane receptor protein involved in Fe transport
MKSNKLLLSFQGFRLSMAGVFLFSMILFANEKETRAVAETDQLSLEDLLHLKVITASKAEESIDDAPNVMYVITKEQIRNRGYKSLKDIFQIIPGFGVQHRDLQFVGQVRGIAANDNEKIALMINSHIVNQTTEPEFFNAGGFPLDNLERLEIIVGPGGVFYGGETLCAIVNLITKKTNYSEVNGSIGGGLNTKAGEQIFPNNDLSLTAGKKVSEDASFFASGSYYERGGFDAWRSNSGNGRNANLASMKDLTGRVYPSYTMFVGSDFKNWSGQFWSQNSQMPDLHLHGNNAAIDGRRFDYINSGVIRNKSEWENGLTSSFEMSGDLKRTLRSIVKVGDKSGVNPNWDLQETDLAMEAAVQHTIADRNFAQLGVQVKNQQLRHNYDFQWDPDKPYTFTQPVYDSIAGDTDYVHLDNMRAIVTPTDCRAAGAYLSDKFTLNKYLKIVAAIRADRNNILDSVKTRFTKMSEVYYSPRAALLVNPIEKLHLKIMYNRATRLSITPQGSPLNHMWGVDMKGLAPSWATANKNITRPEALSTYEAQAIYYWATSRFTINLWHQELKDFATWFSPRTNVGNFTGNGFEYEIFAPINPMISAWTNGALSTNNFDITANPKQYIAPGSTEDVAQFQLPANTEGEVMAVPLFTANAGCDLKLIKKLYINPQVRYFTRQVMAEPVMNDPDMHFGYANNRVYVDLAVSYQNLLFDKLDVRGIIKNLTNNTELIGTQWFTDSYHPQGMTWEIDAFYRF